MERFRNERLIFDGVWEKKDVPLAFANLWSTDTGSHPAAAVFHEWVNNKVDAMDDLDAEAIQILGEGFETSAESDTSSELQGSD